MTISELFDNKLVPILGDVIGLAFPIATIVFLWGVVLYVSSANDTEKIASGRRYMVYGIIALAVMLSVWGIVAVLVETFDFTGIQIPGINP